MYLLFNSVQKTKICMQQGSPASLKVLKSAKI